MGQILEETEKWRVIEGKKWRRNIKKKCKQKWQRVYREIEKEVTKGMKPLSETSEAIQNKQDKRVYDIFVKMANNKLWK
jgi:hypothetical protein